ncbi:MAG: HXXEE domain-containing protein [Clostridiaceae bacterium]
MNNIQVILWLFPMLFIFHDFEEIIFMKIWIDRNRNYLTERFPSLSKKLLPHFDNITTSSFALGVAEEFIIISIITIISYVTKWYSLWLGLFIAFTFHLVVHCLQTLIVRKYVPSIVTSIICLPICIYIIKNILELVTLGTVIMYSIFSLIFMIINLGVIHKLMDVFSNWVNKIEIN